MLNKIILIARLADDPKLRYTPQGTSVADLWLAVERPGTDKGSGPKTDYIYAFCWRETAEFAANYLSKGRLVFVEGHVRVREWVAPDGGARSSVEVVADNLQPLK